MTEEEKQPEMKEAMSIAQFKAITALLAGWYANTNATAKEITGERLYSHSHYHGQERYHILSLQFDGDIILEQNDKGEKYQQRITLEAAEIEPILRQLLIWHLAKAAETKKTDTWDSDPFGDPEPDNEDMRKSDGITVFSLNDDSYSIASTHSSKEDEEDSFTKGIENAYGAHPNDPPLIIGDGSIII